VVIEHFRRGYAFNMKIKALESRASEGEFLGVISLGCVAENMWLPATSLGIGLHIASSLASKAVEAEVKRLLAIPPAMRIVYAIRLGYPAVPAEPSQGGYLRVRRTIPISRIAIAMARDTERSNDSSKAHRIGAGLGSNAIDGRIAGSARRPFPLTFLEVAACHQFHPVTPCKEDYD
jgi:Nitroreductase family